MNPLTLSAVAAVVVFVMMLSRGRGFWKALGAAFATMAAGFLLMFAFVVLMGLGAGLGMAAMLGAVLLAPLSFLLAPVLLIAGIVWIVAYARRNPI